MSSYILYRSIPLPRKDVFFYNRFEFHVCIITLFFASVICVQYDNETICDVLLYMRIIYGRWSLLATCDL